MSGALTENELINFDNKLRHGELPEYKVICTNCFHAWHPRSLTSKCPKCKNKLSIAQRLEIDKKRVVHNCKKCGHEWTQRGNSIIPPRTCPKCNSSTWQKPWGQAVVHGLDGNTYPLGPYKMQYWIRMKIPSGKDGAIRIILKPILAPYSKIA